MFKAKITLLLLLFSSTFLYSEEQKEFSPSLNLSLNFGRYFPNYSGGGTFEVDGYYLDSTRDMKDDMSFGANIKFIFKKRLFVETGVDLIFNEESFKGDILHSDLIGEINTTRDFIRTTAYLNFGVTHTIKEKFSPYISMGPVWVSGYMKEGNIGAEFYPKDNNLDSIQRAFLTVEAAKLQKKMEEQTVEGASDIDFGFNIALGLNYFFENNIYFDIGMRFTDDKLDLGGVDITKTGGLNFFLGAGYSIYKK